MAETTLAKWGNSQGIVIPKSLCKALEIEVGDKLNIMLEDGKLTIQPVPAFTLSSLMEGYNGPMPGEYDWGAPQGKEAW